MCRVLKVNRSSYYAWLKSSPSKRHLENQLLSSKIKEAFIESRCTYGSRRLRKRLMNIGFVISRRRVKNLMKSMGLSCKTKKRFKVTTDSKHKMPIAENILNREFSSSHPNEKFVGDITYIWTQEGWLYLAVVIDLYSRRVVGWSLDKTMTAALVNEALLMAIKSRNPSKGLLWHTDRGSQYASSSHRKLLGDYGIIQSMSRKGNCWDNSVSESFFHTLKTELTYHFNFKTRKEAKVIIFEYIEVFYNRKRLHSTNNYYSPVEYEKMAA
jgi:transposase InsO family protein